MTNTSSTTPLLIVVIALSIAIMEAYAQPTSTPTAPTLAELTAPHIAPGGEFVPPIVAQLQEACGSTTPGICVNLVYASADLVVLTGEALPELQVNRNFYNNFLWQAVQQIKAQGYAIQSVSTIGAGTEANPNVIYVVMTK